MEALLVLTQYATEPKVIKFCKNCLPKEFSSEILPANFSAFELTDIETKSNVHKTFV